MLPTPDATAEMTAVRAYGISHCASSKVTPDPGLETTVEAAIIAGKRAYALAVLEAFDETYHGSSVSYSLLMTAAIAELEQEQARGALTAVGGTS